jgi:hypothetical protein
MDIPGMNEDRIERLKACPKRLRVYPRLSGAATEGRSKPDLKRSPKIKEMHRARGLLEASGLSNHNICLS